MDERSHSDSAGTKNITTVDRKSDLELVVTRIFNAPAHVVFEAWTMPKLFMQWWAPKSSGMKLVSCEMDVRVGGGYRVVFGLDESKSMAFFGTYTDVKPNARLTWTNEESAEGAVTTVTFEDKGEKTLLTFKERYPTKQALDASIEGMEGGMPEQFAQLDELLVTLTSA